jgi:hypothetical protein
LVSGGFAGRRSLSAETGSFAVVPLDRHSILSLLVPHSYVLGKFTSARAINWPISSQLEVANLPFMLHIISPVIHVLDVY